MSDTKKNKHYLGHRARLLKRVLKDLTHAEEYELLEMLLTFAQPRKDVKQQAKEILHTTGSIRDMVHTPSLSYDGIKGIGSSISWYCTLLGEIAQRYASIPSLQTTEVHSNRDKYDISFNRIRQYIEYMGIYAYHTADCILYIGKQREILSMEECPFTCSHVEFITRVIRMRPTHVILIRKITETTYDLGKEEVEFLIAKEKALAVFGIQLLDYIICTPDTMISLRQYNLLQR